MRAFTFAFLTVAALTLAPPSHAQDGGARLPTFDSGEDMRSELDRLMQDRDFVAVVERFSPPDLMSLGRVRVLQDRLKQTLGPLENSGHLILEEPAPGIVSEVIAYWVGDTYAYVYLLTHTRADGVKVLDFRISGDVRAIGDWW